MKYFNFLTLAMLLCLSSTTAQAERDTKAELQSIQKQRQMVAKVKQALASELGAVGKHLKQLDTKLLKARKAYRKVRKEIETVDKRLVKIGHEKQDIQASIQKLFQQMVKEAIAAYQHSGSHSVWVDVLSDTSITEIPHRQFLLKAAMSSQEKDRQAWRNAMQKLAAVEKEEQATKDKLLALKAERKAAEQNLVSKIAEKKKVAGQLRNDISKAKEQDKRLAKQEKALQRLVDGLGDTLLASDKTTKAKPIRKRKGKLPWPLKGKIIIGFGQKTAAGAKLTGVHISPQKRSKEGKEVRSLGQGQVRYADWFGGYGLMMIVDYGQGIMAVYAHNDALHKQLGDWVEKDEVLAEAGSTGWIDDIRLYFEIRDQGKPVSPAHWCNK